MFSERQANSFVNLTKWVSIGATAWLGISSFMNGPKTDKQSTPVPKPADYRSPAVPSNVPASTGQQLTSRKAERNYGFSLESNSRAVLVSRLGQLQLTVRGNAL